jgi:hypothetical protein
MTLGVNMVIIPDYMNKTGARIYESKLMDPSRKIGI